MSMDNDFENDPQPGPAGGNGPSLFLILFLIVGAMTAVFIFQNGERVDTEFLWIDGTPRLWVAIIISIGLGVILDRLILGWWRRSRNNRD